MTLAEHVCPLPSLLLISQAADPPPAQAQHAGRALLRHLTHIAAHQSPEIEMRLQQQLYASRESMTRQHDASPTSDRLQLPSILPHLCRGFWSVMLTCQPAMMTCRCHADLDVMHLGVNRPAADPSPVQGAERVDSELCSRPQGARLTARGQGEHHHQQQQQGPAATAAWHQDWGLLG
jgi:hypothetical protein